MKLQTVHDRCLLNQFWV